MKVQHHINMAAGGYWYRCSRVEFAGETAHWELSQRSRYSFFQAYERSPHDQLIKAKDDDKLRAFVKAWGPFRFPLDACRGSDPIERYRIERDTLKGVVQVLASVEDSAMQQSALTDLFEAWRRASLDGVSLLTVRDRLQLPGSTQSGFDQSFRDWLKEATPAQLESTTDAVLPLLSVSGLTSPGFVVDRSGRCTVLKAELGLSSLSAALHWMVWQDVFQKHPYQFCTECRHLFQAITRHKKKFCSPECAHRKSGREWQQRKRNNEKGHNGAQ